MTFAGLYDKSLNCTCLIQPQMSDLSNAAQLHGVTRQVEFSVIYFLFPFDIIQQ